MEYHDQLFTKTRCSSLAFHKSLIGLAELNAAETLADKTDFTQLLQARAISTYYVVYHLFTACMLLAPGSFFKEPLQSPRKYGKVTAAELNDPSERPAQWDLCADNEMDWATNIRHRQIKEFCKRVRAAVSEQTGETTPYIDALYRHFIGPTDFEGPCLPGLLEKLCYVRDRVVYRPTFIETPSDGQIQTSAQLHRELTSLPSSKELYRAITEVYDGLMGSVEYDSCKLMLAALWSETVRDDLDALCALGHDRRRLQHLGKRDPDSEGYLFPCYICHLLELENIDFILRYKRKYWAPLEKKYLARRRA